MLRMYVCVYACICVRVCMYALKSTTLSLLWCGKTIYLPVSVYGFTYVCTFLVIMWFLILWDAYQDGVVSYLIHTCMCLHLFWKVLSQAGSDTTQSADICLLCHLWFKYRYSGQFRVFQRVFSRKPALKAVESCFATPCSFILLGQDLVGFYFRPPHWVGYFEVVNLRSLSLRL